MEDNPSTRIDEKIAHLQCTEKLKEERNLQLAPIYKLPPEILGTIFSFVLDGGTSQRFLLPDYYFTHVSRLWRSVGLNTPRLWRVIVQPSSNSWATAMLERSNAADLVIVVHLGYHSLSSNIALESFLQQVFMKHASRVRELELDLLLFFPSTWAETFAVLQPSSLHLHSLRLVPSVPNFFHEGKVCLTFPTGVLETENLRRLEIEDCDGPWYSSSFPSLTTLKLDNIRNRPPLTEFVELLRGLANLQVLDMNDSLPRGPLHRGLIDPVHLPNLQYLCLSTRQYTNEVANIMSCIIVPPTLSTLKFLIHTRDHGGAEYCIKDLEASFSTFFSRMGLDRPPYRALRVAGKDINLQAWNDDSGSVSEPNLEVFIQLNSGDSQLITRDLFPIFPFFNITTLTLDIDPVDILLRHIFVQLPHLEKIIAVRSCAVQVINELTPSGNYYDDTQLSDFNSVTFPALKSLSFVQALFGQDTIDTLKSCLKERCKRNAEILKLEFLDCSELFCEQVENLREIVDVEWDEIELVVEVEYEYSYAD